MKIGLITDLHIDDEGILPLNIDTRANFQRILEKVVSKNYDLLVIAGDICNKTGNEAIYQWVRYQLDGTAIPYLAISGNHDTSTLLAEVFDWKNRLQHDELYFTYELDENNLIFLDTSKGNMSEHQWEWLNQVIKTIEKEVFIFMHHPPLMVGSLHMEPRYSFTQIERFESFCRTYPQHNFNVFTGHFHIERSIVKENLQVFITPSTFFQIDPDCADFRISNSYIGFREINIFLEKDFNTCVIYL
jgi:3',5'-cyclic-AMP phosphodiesterase